MFDSCSAYQVPEILFLSHCVPYPPNKGERIRAFRDLLRLSSAGNVHLACFARSPEEERAALSLQHCCASIHVEPLRPRLNLLSAAVRFAAGACLTTSYYEGAGLRKHVEGLSRVDVTVAYSSAMARYAPPSAPVVLDMVDVDSEKWVQYAALRAPGFAYAAEGRRLRRLEATYGARATSVLFATRHEADVFQAFASHPRPAAMENGVDFEYFDPAAVYGAVSEGAPLAVSEGAPLAVPGSTPLMVPRLVFVGEMNYFPNVDAVCRFAREVFPAIRRECEGLQFMIVGRNPTRAVQRLAGLPGVEVTGGVPDVRPYLLEALAVVAPLRVARGIQNKVLEALAMGKQVLASTAVVATLGKTPYGVVRCESPADYLRALADTSRVWPYDPAIRKAARARFTWSSNLDVLSREVAYALGKRSVV